MKAKGFDGRRQIVTTKNKIILNVLLKNDLNQTSNKIIGQIIIKVLGLTPIYYVFIEISGICSGLLKYVDETT